MSKVRRMFDKLKQEKDPTKVWGWLSYHESSKEILCNQPKKGSENCQNFILVPHLNDTNFESMCCFTKAKGAKDKNVKYRNANDKNAKDKHEKDMNSKDKNDQFTMRGSLYTFIDTQEDRLPHIIEEQYPWSPLQKRNNDCWEFLFDQDMKPTSSNSENGLKISMCTKEFVKLNIFVEETGLDMNETLVNIPELDEHENSIVYIIDQTLCSIDSLKLVIQLLSNKDDTFEISIAGKIQLGFAYKEFEVNNGLLNFKSLRDPRSLHYSGMFNNQTNTEAVQECYNFYVSNFCKLNEFISDEGTSMKIIRPKQTPVKLLDILKQSQLTENEYQYVGNLNENILFENVKIEEFKEIILEKPLKKIIRKNENLSVIVRLKNRITEKYNLKQSAKGLKVNMANFIKELKKNIKYNKYMSTECKSYKIFIVEAIGIADITIECCCQEKNQTNKLIAFSVSKWTLKNGKMIEGKKIIKKMMKDDERQN